ncbi:MAG: sialate O-acetylesterase [Bacillus subtilis]|nr:sialate O-acetylesterase [Bacillus subtilis]
MVDAWRAAFEEPYLPFVFVQLAGYRYPGLGSEGIMTLRDQQLLAVSFADHRYMVSAIDQGEPENIHPKQKRRISERIANLLLERRLRNRRPRRCRRVAVKAHRKGSTITVVIPTTGNNLPLQCRSTEGTVGDRL